MANFENYGKSLLRRIAKDTGLSLTRGILMLRYDVDIKNLFDLRVVEERGKADYVWVEANYVVCVPFVNKLWAFYSKRRVDVEKATLTLQIRDATFPGFNLPEWGFSLAMNDTLEREKAVKILESVINEKLVSLAESCMEITFLADMLEEKKLSGHKVDNILIYAISGRVSVALGAINEARMFWSDPMNNFGASNIILKIVDCIDRDIKIYGPRYAAELSKLCQ